VARPKSEDKRNAILDAATRVFAERGLTAAPRLASPRELCLRTSRLRMI
jgi:hypothetical protein